MFCRVGGARSCDWRDLPLLQLLQLQCVHLCGFQSMPHSQMHIWLPQGLLSRHRQESQPPAGQLRARQSVREAARTAAMRDDLTPEVRPDTAISVKKFRAHKIPITNT